MVDGEFVGFATSGVGGVGAKRGAVDCFPDGFRSFRIVEFEDELSGCGDHEDTGGGSVISSFPERGNDLRRPYSPNVTPDNLHEQQASILEHAIPHLGLCHESLFGVDSPSGIFRTELTIVGRSGSSVRGGEDGSDWEEVWG